MRKRSFTKEQILEACAKVIAKKGLENTSVDDIALEAKISKGSIYTYFKTKDQILREGIRYSASEKIDTLDQLIIGYRKAKKKLEVLAKVNDKIAKKHPEMYLMNYSLLFSTHKNLKKISTDVFFTSYLEYVESIIKEGIKNHEFKKIDTKTLALAFILTQDIANILNSFNPKKKIKINSSQLIKLIIK